MEIEDLEYEKRPFNTNKMYEVHTLSSNGFTRYIGNDSYAHKYLERKPPKILSERENNNENLFYSTSTKNFFSLKKSLFDKSQEEMENSNKNKLQSNEENKQANKTEESMGENKQLMQMGNNEETEKKFSENKNYNFNNEAENQYSNKNKDSRSPMNIQMQAKTSTNFFDIKNQKFNDMNNNNNNNKNENETNNKKVTLLKAKNGAFTNTLKNTNNNFNFNSIYNNYNLSTMNNYNNTNNFMNTNNGFMSTKSNMKTTSSKNFSISTEKTYYYQKSNLDPLSRRLNITGSNFRKTINTDSNSLTNSRFDKNYLQNLNLFINSKSYFNMDKIPDPDEGNKRYDGFQSYNVPHVENLFSENEYLDENSEENNNNEYKTNTKNQNSEKKNKKPISLLAEKIAKSCVGNKKLSFDLTQSISKLKEVQEENEKLKKIMMIQTSSDFLKKSRLPEIQYCVSQPKLRIKKNELLIGGRVKHMGGRYNPYNFQAGRDCETNRRNQFGSLFQH